MSGEPIEELLIKISADMSGLVASMTKTGQVVDQLAGQIGSKVEHGMAHSFAVAELAVHAFEKALEFVKEHTIDLVKESFAHIEAQTRLADRLGITTEAMGGLTSQAEHAGSSMESLAQAMTIMERNLASAGDKGNEAGFALKALGLNVKELIALKPDEQMAEIGGALDKVKNAADRTQIAMALFGRGGAQMINVLRGGKEAMMESREEAEKIGVAISRIDAEKILAANRQFKTMHEVIEGIGNRLAITSAPFLEAIVKKLNEAAIESNGFESQIKSALQGAATGVAYVSDALIGFEIMWDGIKLAVSLFGATVYNVLNDQVQVVVNVTKAILDLFKTMFDGILSTARYAFDKLADGIALFDEDAASSMRSFANSVGDGIQKTVDDTKKAIDGVLTDITDTSQGLADQSRQTVEDAKNDLDEAINQPIPHDAIIQWAEDVIAVADETSKKVADSIATATSGGGEGGDGGGGAKDRQQHLQELRDALQLETETEISMHEEREALLKTMRDNHELSVEEANMLEERELERHHRAMYAIAKKGGDRIDSVEKQRRMAIYSAQQSFFGNIMTLSQGHSKKVFELAKVAAIANATISGIEAAVHAWKWGMETGGPYAAAAFTAASIAATAVQISQIASQSFNGGGGGGGSSGGGIPAIQGAPTAGAGQNGGASGKFVNITLMGDGKYDRKQIEDLVSGINDAVGDGVILRTH